MPILHSPFSIFHSRRHRRRAFTLVELLTVVVIISILATLGTVAYTAAMQMARESKTRGTIQKLDAAIIPIFERYEERFERILRETLYFDGSTWKNYTSGLSSDDEALLKIYMIRDLMRMEMPNNFTEVEYTNSLSGTNDATKYQIPYQINSTNYIVARSPVHQYYLNAKNTASEEQAAELLFLIIANLNPEALEGFSGTEIADTNGNGLMEFIDAWGRPIRFIRWAPALLNSDVQPNILKGISLGLANNDVWTDNGNGSSKSTFDDNWNNAVARQSDPFDPDNLFDAKLSQSTSAINSLVSRPVKGGFFLYPLIVSAGPDGKFDITFWDNDNSSFWQSNATNPFLLPYGIPGDMDDNGSLDCYDNIHNHSR